jgi:cold shock CspA family protein
MRFEGVLKTCNDERGFGFIQPTNGGQEVFVHIKSFPSGVGRPALNLKITFEVEQIAEGKKTGEERPAGPACESICLG